MGTPYLTYFCCGFSLYAGALIIGWLQLLGSSLGLIFAGSLMCRHEYIVMKYDSNHSIILSTDHLGMGLFFVAVIGVKLSILLLVGSKKRSQQYLSMWVILSSFGYTTLFAFVAILIIKCIAAGFVLNGFTWILFLLILSGTVFYFICIVHNLAKQFLTERYNQLKV